VKVDSIAHVSGTLILYSFEAKWSLNMHIAGDLRIIGNAFYLRQVSSLKIKNHIRIKMSEEDRVLFIPTGILN
jgi:hypothetical protein